MAAEEDCLVGVGVVDGDVVCGSVAGDVDVDGVVEECAHDDWVWAVSLGYGDVGDVCLGWDEHFCADCDVSGDVALAGFVLEACVDAVVDGDVVADVCR